MRPTAKKTSSWACWRTRSGTRSRLSCKRARFEARRHTLRLDPVDPALAVVGDTVRLTQVIENLLINAAKYTPDNGSIDVSAEAVGGDVAIAVKDTGIGIAPDMLRRVFDLFAQADTSLDRAEGGLGIGLTLAERLTRMHGGRLEAHSAGARQGSTFTVRLPRVDGHVEKEAAPRASEAPNRLLRILIVDDNHDSAEMLQTLMEMSGHTALIAHDGVSAVPAALLTRPDVILMDIGLPGKDGYQLVKELRSLPEVAAARIVATTGYGRAQDRALPGRRLRRASDEAHRSVDARRRPRAALKEPRVAFEERLPSLGVRTPAPPKTRSYARLARSRAAETPR